MTESYHGTRGHSGGDTSKDAAIAERDKGTTSEMMRRVKILVDAADFAGITSAELRAAMPGEHHGRITSALTKLHIAGEIVALTERRGNCGIYVMPGWVLRREVRPYRRQNVRLQVEDVQSLLLEHRLGYPIGRDLICVCRAWKGDSVLAHQKHLAEVIVALSRGEL